MNLVQQFLEENLSKQLNHRLLQQIQNSNSAVQTLVNNLEGLRFKQSYSTIQNKIKRVENYLQVKNDILTNLQVVNQSNALFEWLLQSLVSQKFIYQLIKKQQYIMQKQLIQIGRRIFLSQNNYQRNHIQQSQSFKILIRDLQIINEERSTGSLKGLNRQKIIQIDTKLKTFQEKIKQLQQNVEKFNIQILVFIKNIYAFQQKIRAQFIASFSTRNHDMKRSSTIQQQQQQKYSRNASQKSHISINSNNQDNNEFKSSISRKQIYQNQRPSLHTPRKLLQNHLYDEFQQQFDRKKRSSLNHQSKRGSQIMSNAGSYIGNKLDIDEFRNMGKTLSNFNYQRPAQTTNPLYTTTNFGGKVRLPTNWSNQNSRSSISYYPPR